MYKIYKKYYKYLIISDQPLNIVQRRRKEKEEARSPVCGHREHVVFHDRGPGGHHKGKIWCKIW